MIDWAPVLWRQAKHHAYTVDIQVTSLHETQAGQHGATTTGSTMHTCLAQADGLWLCQVVIPDKRCAVSMIDLQCTDTAI